MISDYVCHAIIVASILYILHRLVRNYLVLRRLHLPGPALAKFTSKWLLLQFLRGKRALIVHSLHLKYGPVVQLEPETISFTTPRALKDIYGSDTPCTKAKIYDNFGPPSLFTFRDKDKHRERRRRVAHAFAPSVLKDLEPAVQDQVSIFLRLVPEKISWDVVKPTRTLALDIGGEVLLGKAFGAQGKEKDEMPYYVQVMNYVHPMFGLANAMPWLAAFVKRLPFKFTKDFAGSVDYIFGYGDQRLRESIEKYGRQSRRRDLLTKLVAGDPEKGTLPLSDQEISYDVSGFIYAATDATAMNMAYLLYELAAYPEWQSKVRAEIKEAGLKRDGYPYQVIQGLSVLQACLYESMRLHPATGLGMPRLTPPEGMLIDGVFVPGNINVCVSVLNIQSNPQVFPNPDTYDPSRWLTNTSPPKFSPTADMQSHLFLWGSGDTTCMGRDMATMEIKIMASRMLGTFEAIVEGEQTHRDMEMCDHVVMAPKGGKAMLVFKKLEGE
ncbi:cytochrome P450 [Lojkania enalia]|uniref:Cytochrome P450 n=1 Tax=Lojkania enalia TaxID=147567 RepID=A0A9P4KBQ8_9PLEO|nr:cytochrome P450 [Didymosphaeria enalia]